MKKKQALSPKLEKARQNVKKVSSRGQSSDSTRNRTRRQVSHSPEYMPGKGLPSDDSPKDQFNRRRLDLSAKSTVQKSTTSRRSDIIQLAAAQDEVIEKAKLWAEEIEDLLRRYHNRDALSSAEKALLRAVTKLKKVEK